MGSPRRCPELCTAQFLLTIYCAVHILPLRGGQPRKTQSEGGAAAPEEGSNDPDRHHPEVQQGQRRRRSEELRRRFQGRPGDRGRDRRLRQEVLRAVAPPRSRSSSAPRRSTRRSRSRPTSSSRPTRASSRSRPRSASSMRASRRRPSSRTRVSSPSQRQGREVSRRTPSTECEAPGLKAGRFAFRRYAPHMRDPCARRGVQVVGTRGANDLAKRRRRFYITDFKRSVVGCAERPRAFNGRRTTRHGALAAAHGIIDAAAHHRRGAARARG